MMPISFGADFTIVANSVASMSRENAVIRIETRDGRMHTLYFETPEAAILVYQDARQQWREAITSQETES